MAFAKFLGIHKFSFEFLRDPCRSIRPFLEPNQTRHTLSKGLEIAVNVLADIFKIFEDVVQQACVEHELNKQLHHRASGVR